jgi:biopolymer transport protein ExbB
VDGLSHFWDRSDAVGRAVALLLLAMSVAAWVVILWKGWVLRRAAHDNERGSAAFWTAASVDDARARLNAIDRERLLLPLVEAAVAQPGHGTLEAGGQQAAQLTRRLRDALHQGLAHLQYGQVLLASVGSTAPFVGLFGTVWGIYHALVGITSSGSLSIEKVSGPVGEALIMTAAGIAVAVPAVLAYNIYGKWIAAAEAELEGFAHDLRQMVLDLVPHGSPRTRPAEAVRAGSGSPDPAASSPGA